MIDRCPVNRTKHFDISIEELRIIDEALDMLSWEQHVTLKKNEFTDQIAQKYARILHAWEKEIKECGL